MQNLTQLCHIVSSCVKSISPRKKEENKFKYSGYLTQSNCCTSWIALKKFIQIVKKGCFFVFARSKIIVNASKFCDLVQKKISISTFYYPSIMSNIPQIRCEVGHHDSCPPTKMSSLAPYKYKVGYHESGPPTKNSS